MVIDTSILIHIVFNEPGWKHSYFWLSRQVDLCISAVSLVEAQALVKTRSSLKSREIDKIINLLGVQVLSFDEPQSISARKAYNVYGKGQKHKAKLNFGDCLVYGLAATRSDVLAFVGNDFNHIDLEVIQFPIKRNLS